MNESIGLVPDFPEPKNSDDLNNLEILDISNNPEEERFLRIDTSFRDILGFRIIIPVLILIITCCCSIFTPTLIETSLNTTQIQNVGKDFELKYFSDKIIPSLQFLFIDIEFELKGPISLSEIPFQAALKGSCKRGNHITLKTLQGNLVDPLQIDSTTYQTPRIPLFSSEVLKYDTLELSIKTEGNTQPIQSSTFHITYCNHDATLIIAISRIFFSIFLIPTLIRSIIYLFPKNSKRPTIEQKFTFFVVILIFLYIDPLYALHSFSPSVSHLYRHLIFRDAAFSFSAFYCLALFTYFGRDPKVNLFISLAPPYIYLACVGFICLASDVSQPLKNISSFLPALFKPYDTIFDYHYLAFFSFLFAYVVYVILSAGKINSNQKARLINTSVIIGVETFLLLIYFILMMFSYDFQISTASKLVPMAIMVSFAMLIEYLHEDEPIASPREEYRADFGDDVDNTIGIEEDTNAIEQNKKFQNLDLSIPNEESS